MILTTSTVTGLSTKRFNKIKGH